MIFLESFLSFLAHSFQESGAIRLDRGVIYLLVFHPHTLSVYTVTIVLFRLFVFMTFSLTLYGSTGIMWPVKPCVCVKENATVSFSTTIYITIGSITYHIYIYIIHHKLVRIRDYIPYLYLDSLHLWKSHTSKSKTWKTCHNVFHVLIVPFWNNLSDSRGTWFHGASQRVDSQD